MEVQIGDWTFFLRDDHRWVDIKDGRFIRWSIEGNNYARLMGGDRPIYSVYLYNRVGFKLATLLVHRDGKEAQTTFSYLATWNTFVECHPDKLAILMDAAEEAGLIFQDSHPEIQR